MLWVGFCFGILFMSPWLDGVVFCIKHKWRKIQPTERQYDLALKLRVHPIKDLHCCENVA